MLPRRKERLDAELLKPPVGLRGGTASHYSDHLRCQLERCAFESDPTWRDVEAEAEINVKNVTGIVYHNVAVMPILELE